MRDVAARADVSVQTVSNLINERFHLMGGDTRTRVERAMRELGYHPNRAALWEANLTLRKLEKLRQKPDIKGVFVRQIDLYERELRRLATFLRTCDHQIAFIGEPWICP